MITVEKAQKTNGVLLKGDFFELDRLYFAIHKFLGFHGLHSKCTFPDRYDFCESLLGLCYEIRHAWQGDRGIAEIYNGIKNDWFDDYERILPPDEDSGEFTKSFKDSDYDYDDENDYDGDYDDEDDDYDDEDDEDDEIYYDEPARFSRAEYPDAREKNTYFSIHLPFTEAVFYALVMSDLLKEKDTFLQARKRMATDKNEDYCELNKEYLMFQAEQDIARMTLFVKQTLHALYRYIGEERYNSFANKLDKAGSLTKNCSCESMNNVLVAYGEKEYEQDDPDILLAALSSFLK